MYYTASSVRGCCYDVKDQVRVEALHNSQSPGCITHPDIHFSFQVEETICGTERNTSDQLIVPEREARGCGLCVPKTVFGVRHPRAK